jgi:hypothetical protein
MKDQYMSKRHLLTLALTSIVSVTAYAAPFADAVVSYNPGSGFTSGYTDASVALGEPSRVNPFFDPTDPFNPPYGQNQIVSVGTSGSLVVKFDAPVQNHPKNRFGIDFMIFGNSGFIITNEFDFNTFQWVGTPATDGSLFAANSGVTAVSVSKDGTNFYQLNPAIAPTVDGLYPTDGNGNFQIPVDPTLTASDFAGLTLDDMRLFYLGSGGGTGYDISWALDGNGNRVSLDTIKYIRVDVISGKSEIDAFSAVMVPKGASKKK